MKFSIVLPVYNSEKYLEKCIDSIIHQCYANWELLIVDDGSQDNSWKIIEKYILNDRRIQGYRQANAGPGIARNVGIQKATGDYLVFVDSDDYIDRDYLSLLKSKAEKYDLVFIDVLQVNEKGNIIRVEKMSKYQNLTKDSLLRSQMTGKIMWGGVRKAVNMNIIRENNINYSSFSNGEENLYSFRILNDAQTYAFMDEKPLYMYVNRQGSQSKLVDDDPYISAFIVLRNHIKSIEKYEEYANTLNAFNIAVTVVSIDRITQMYKGKERKKRIKERLSLFEQMHDSKYPIDKKNLIYKAKMFIPTLKIGCSWPIVLSSLLRKKIASMCCYK